MGNASLLTSLADSVATTGVSAVGLMRVSMDEVSAYGVVTPAAGAPEGGPVAIVDVVEKPRREDAPSNLIIIGRYVLTPDVFDEIAGLAPHANGEIQLTDALRNQAHRSPLTGVLNTSRRWDTGTPIGWLGAVVDAALDRSDVSDQFARLLRERLG